MDYSGQNINRVNAVKQLRKAINDSNSNDFDVGDFDDQELFMKGIRLGASIANSFIYIGDMMKERNDLIGEELDYKMKMNERLLIKSGI